MQISNGAATPHSSKLRKQKALGRLHSEKNSLFMARSTITIVFKPLIIVLDMAEKADRISDLISKLTEQTKKTEILCKSKLKVQDIL